MLRFSALMLLLAAAFGTAPAPAYYTETVSQVYSNVFGNKGTKPMGNCVKDTVLTILDQGRAIRMLSGAIYEVREDQTQIAETWMTSNDVLVCPLSIINRDRNGDEVNTMRVQP